MVLRQLVVENISLNNIKTKYRALADARAFFNCLKNKDFYVYYNC